MSFVAMGEGDDFTLIDRETFEFANDDAQGVHMENAGKVAGKFGRIGWKPFAHFYRTDNLRSLLIIDIDSLLNYIILYR